MRLAFLGTPEAAVPSLDALVSAGHEVALVISRPDRRRGRGSALSPSPVKAAALAHGLRVSDSLASLNDVDVELGVVVAYGAMIPAAILERTPMLNVHFSLLPRWRGAAPVERAILAGDEVTGVGIISLEPTLDTGPLHAHSETSIADKTVSELTLELARMGAQLLIEVLASPEKLTQAKAQVGESTYAAKLTPETFHLAPDMDTTQARRVVALERAFVYVQGKRLRILRVASSSARVTRGHVLAQGGVVALGLNDGSLELVWVQPEGSRPMSASAWWAGARLSGDIEWN